MNRSPAGLFLSGLGVLALAIGGCSSSTTKPPASTDTTPPAAVANLASGTVTSNSIVLTWTAPGDDENTGTAHQFSIRRSLAEITEANFASAVEVSGVPAPLAAGTHQTVTATGLTPGTPYYFAMRTADEVPNWSTVSNVIHVSTEAPDTIPPAAVADLLASAPDSTEIVVSWTSPGDDAGTGTAAQYDLRMSTATITSANFGSATQVHTAPAPLAAGTVQTATVTGLTPNTPYYFALKTADEVPNWSDISNVAQGQTVPSPPRAPTGVTAIAGDGAVTIEFTASTGATSYNLYYATSSQNATRASGTKVAEFQSGGTVQPLTNYTTYYFVATAVGPGGESVESTPAAVAMPNTVRVSADVVDEAGGLPPNMGANAWVQVYVGDEYITTATVTLNGVALPYVSGNHRYEETLTVQRSTAYALDVTIPGDPNHYTATASSFTTYPTVTAPPANTTIHANLGAQVTWTQGAPTSGLEGVIENGVAIFDVNVHALFGGAAPDSGGPVNIPIATSYTLPAGGANWQGTGAGLLMVALRNKVPVTNAGAGADEHNSLRIWGFSPSIPVTVQ